ncbi:auxin response factor [Medicago truncatula]|uniref:Auxin response factor n=1 Tax=Medicago truncatula TaxID=3880 RepID=G7JXN7_MEDTR|nr:auxin response factor [Medicago truncatula]
MFTKFDVQKYFQKQKYEGLEITIASWGQAANSHRISLPSSVLSANNMPIDALVVAANRTLLPVVYYPGACVSEFVVPLSKYNNALFVSQLSIGLRFDMMFETKAFDTCCNMGTIVGISDLDPLMWPDSRWKNIEVKWDKPDCGGKPNRVCSWDILLSSRSLASSSKRPLQSRLSEITCSQSAISLSRSKKCQDSSVVEMKGGSTLKMAEVLLFNDPVDGSLEGVTENIMLGQLYPIGTDEYTRLLMNIHVSILLSSPGRSKGADNKANALGLQIFNAPYYKHIGPEWFLGKEVYDHCPIMLSEASQNWVPKPFCMLNCWKNIHGKKRESNSQNPRPYLKVGCEASLRIKKNCDAKWIVHSFIKDHNHELFSAYSHYFPCHREINKAQKHSIETLHHVWSENKQIFCHNGQRI